MSAWWTSRRLAAKSFNGITFESIAALNGRNLSGLVWFGALVWWLGPTRPLCCWRRPFWLWFARQACNYECSRLDRRRRCEIVSSKLDGTSSIAVGPTSGDHLLV